MVARHADAEPPGPVWLRRLPHAVILIADQLECPIEGDQKITGIVDDVHAVLVGETGPVGHLLGADEVAPPDLRRIESEASRCDVEQTLHHERGLRPSGAAVCGAGRLVGDHVLGDVAVMGNPVGRAKVDDGVERGRVVLNGVGAEVRLELAVDGEDGAVATESHLHLVRLLAIVTGGH